MTVKTRYLILSAIFLISVFASLSLGTETLSVRRLLSPSEIDRIILFNIRIPRIMAGFIVGAGLTVAGAILQALLRNPLAESYTLGISGGASLGICTGVILGRMSVIPYFAFAGALLSVSIIIIASARKRLSNTTVILLGVALNFLFSSFVLFVMAVIKNDKFQSTLLWLLGDLSYFPRILLLPAAITITAVTVYFTLSGRILDIISVGDEKALSMGVNIEREKKTAFILCCLITAFCVSLAGIIGFVGLIIPHITRFLFGSSHKKNLAAGFIAGGTFLVIADTMARTLIKPVEIPVGVITGFFGGIFFLSLLLKNRYAELK